MNDISRKLCKFFLILVLASLTLCMNTSMAGVPDQKKAPNDKILQTKALMDSGQLMEAALYAEKEAAGMGAAGSGNDESEMLMMQAEALSLLGHNNRALEIVTDARAKIRNPEDNDLQARISLLQGALLVLKMKPSEAKTNISDGLDRAVRIGKQDLIAKAYTSLGNLYASTEKYDEATTFFLKSSEIHKAQKNRAEMVNSLVNAGRSSIESQKNGKGKEYLVLAKRQADFPVRTRWDIFTLLAIGDLAISYNRQYPKEADILEGLDRIYDSALNASIRIKDQTAESYALEGLGALREIQGKPDEALDLTYRAILKAHKSGTPEAMVGLHWQAGRISKTLGKTKEALSEYEKTVYYVKQSRNDLSEDCRSGKNSYRNLINPIFTEYIDLLLGKASESGDPKEKKILLGKTLAALESLKAAEIQDYFKDGCITAMQAKIAAAGDVGSNTAVLYPVILPQRTELLLSLSDEIIQKTVMVKSEKIAEAINNFRSRLESPGNDFFLKDSKKIYEWILEPVIDTLEKKSVKTIVIVPDGPIRTIPLSALHDGKNFLVEKYSIVITPGLTLTDPNPIKKNNINLLMAGLTESVQGFSALPSVHNEAEYIKKNFKGKILQNVGFTASSMEDSLENQPYTIVHIATHGQFDSNPSKTFLLTYDGRLTLDDLDKLIKPSRYSENPVELLTLSACQTAVGDDRAALGLAGVAIKSGARCALASLWFIDDEATSMLITKFYEELKTPGVSKAEAIRLAQMNLLGQERFSHPAFWSPFILIGNWL